MAMQTASATICVHSPDDPKTSRDPSANRTRKKPQALRAVQPRTLAHRLAVPSFQFTENEGGHDGHSTQHKKCAMDAMNELRGAGRMTIGNEKRGH